MRKKFIIFSLSIILIIAAGLYLFLQTDASRKFVKSFIENAVSYTPNFKLTIGELRGSIISNLEAEDVLITIGGETFVKADKVNTSYSIPLILSVITRGDIPLYNTVVEGVEVNIVKHTDGRWNYDKIGDGKKDDDKEDKDDKGSKFSLFLSNSRIKSGSVKIINRNTDDLLEFKVTEDSSFSIDLIGMKRRFEIDAYDLNVDWLPAGIRFRNFKADAILSGQNIAFKNTSGNFQGIDVAGQGIVNNFRRPEFSFTAYFNNLQPEGIGEFNVYAKAEGKLVSKDNLDAKVDVSLVNSELRGKRIWTNLETVEVKGTTASIKGNINTDFGRSYVDGVYNFYRFLTKKGKNSFSFSADLDEVDTTEFFEVLRIEPEKFEVGKDSKLDSSLNFNGYWINSADHSFKMSYKSLKVEDKKLGNLDITGDATIYPEKAVLDIKSKLSNINIKSALKFYDFNNSVNGILELKGSIPFNAPFRDKSDLAVKGNLKTGSAYGLDNIDSSFSGSLKNGSMNISALEIISDQLFLRAQKKSEKTGLSYKMESSDIGFLKKIDSRLDVKGKLVSDGVIRGDILDPVVEADANISGFSYGKGYEADNININLVSNTDPDNPEVTLDSELSDLRVMGKYLDRGKISIRNQGKDIITSLSLSRAQGQNQYLDSEFLLSGITNTKKTVTVKNLELTLGDSNLKNRDEIILTVTPGKKVLEHLNLTYRDGLLESDGVIESNGNIDFNAYLTNFDQKLIPIIFDFNETMGGKLSGDIKINGTMNRPDISMNLISKDLLFGDFKSRGFNINLNAKNRNINVDVKSINEDFDELRLAGDIKTDLAFSRFSENIKDAKLDMMLRTNKFDIAFFKPLLSSVRRMDGTFSSDIKIGGTLSSPKISGKLFVSKTELEVSQILNELVVEKATIDFQDSLIKMNDTRVSSLNGSAVIDGVYNLSDSTYSGNAELDELYIKLPFLRADMSGNLELEGKNEKVEVKSELKVANKKIYFEQEQSKSVKDIKFIDEENQQDLIVFREREPDYFTKNFKVDMAIDIPRGTEIISKGIDVEVVGQMFILKEYNQKNIFRGNIDILKGHYIVLGKLFNIDDGSLNFPSSPDPNPQIEINASYDISDIEVFINITGTAKDPVISFSSNPPLEKDDIISYLVYGASQENRGDQEQAAIGGGLAANVAAGEISRIIGSNLGLDVLNFQGGESGGLSNPQIQVGSFITDDLFISYERTSDENLTEPRAINADNRVRLQWKINESFSVESEIGDQNSGADIIYNFDF